MSKVFWVAWRDFKYTVLTKAFILAVVGVPILMIGVGGIAVVIMATHEPPPLKGKVAIIDATGRVIDAARLEFDPRQIEAEQDAQIREAMETASDMMNQNLAVSPTPVPGGMNPRGGVVEVEVEGHTDEHHLEAVQERVRAGELLAVAVIPDRVLRHGLNRDATEEGTPDAGRTDRYPLFVNEKISSEHTTIIERRVGQAIVRVRAELAGLDLAATRAMLDRPRADTDRFLAAGGAARESEAGREIRRTMLPMAFMMLLWIAVFSVGQHLLNSTIEEKSNRVMEVLLSAVSPMQLMTGKILGQGVVGLIILVVYSSMGIAGLIYASLSNMIDPITFGLFAIYFFIAYALIAALMTAVGSAVSDIREANSLLTPVMIVLFIPLLLWMPITQSPNGLIATVFSFIPPIIPFVMVLRIASDTPPPVWQILLSLVWGGFCVFATIWLAAKIFRVGVLMTGKPPTPRELLKWLTYR